MLVTTNDKTKEIKTLITFEEENLTIAVNQGTQAMKDFKYDDIKAAEYSFAKTDLIHRRRDRHDDPDRRCGDSSAFYEKETALADAQNRK